MYIIFLSINFFISCTDKNTKATNEILCTNDSIIYLNNKISFWFIKDSSIISSRNIRVEQIRNGKTIAKLNYSKNIINNQIEIIDNLSLRKNDSLKIVYKNNKSFILYDFRNTPDYGGRKFLGCSFGSYKINGKEIGLIDRNVLSIY